MKAVLAGVASYLPEGRITNQMIVERYPDWTEEQIVEKTGIHERRVAAAGEYASDLAIKAVEKLLALGLCAKDEVDFIIGVSQTPDYMAPHVGAIIQDRMGFGPIASMDLPLACSGYVYALGVARGLVETGQAKNLLIVTADTYSRYTQHAERNVGTLFGDGATATLIKASDAAHPVSGGVLGATEYGTDGAGIKFLRIDGAGQKAFTGEEPQENGQPPILVMDGPEVFGFTMKTVVRHIKHFIAAQGLGVEELDHVVFHQANAWMIEHLRKRLKIPPEHFVVHMSHTGNTVSSTIPLAFESIIAEVKPGAKLLFSGFGMGLSWGSVLLDWQ